MRLWTYQEIRQKVERDLDLEDEDFITRNELVGYCNEAIDAAEALILKIDEDYFLSKQLYDLTVAQTTLTLPTNIWGQKIRRLMYNDGSLIYAIKRIRRLYEFENLAWADTFPVVNDYGYILDNSVEGAQASLTIHPPSQITRANVLTLWYIRNANRVPLTGDYIGQKTFRGPEVLASPANRFRVNSHGLVTGDVIKIFSVSGPIGLTLDTPYWVTVIDSNTFQISSSLLNLKNSIFVTLAAQSDSSQYYFSVQVNETTQDATVIDIPEFASFLIQFIKCRVYEKEPDPRYDAALKALAAHEQLMVDTLTDRVPDDDSRIQMDMTFYREHS